MSAQRLSIACFGESLWDILPRGIFLGGAPLNTAYHLTRLGVHARPISAVGCDFLGDEILRRLTAWDIDARGVARLRGRPTGTVHATIDSAGNASYRISRDVAWDRIPVSGERSRRSPLVAIVYGSLALREDHNRRALDRIMADSPDALRVLDLNLRAPFDRPAVLNHALRRAQLVKLNDDELARMTGGSVGRPGAVEKAARRFADRHRVTRVCVSAGARGAGLLWDGTWFWENARPVRVRDTIGAGDAFLAGLLHALLVRRAPPGAALVRACRLGEFVAGCDGATPPYRVDRRGHPRATE